MALKRSKKSDIIKEISELLSSSKMTVIADYSGTTVKKLQILRKEAKQNNTKISVIKNRLFIKALESSDKFTAVDKSVFSGQLLYAFNSDDEIAPAQAINNFAKLNPSIQFVGGVTQEGTLMSAEDIQQFATLPSKNELIAQVISILESPLNDTLNAVSGNLHSILDGIRDKATN